MKSYSFLLPEFFFECIERYHVYHNPKNGRSFDETVSVILNYVLGYTYKISLQELEVLEAFFEKNEEMLPKILKWVLTTGHNSRVY